MVSFVVGPVEVLAVTEVPIDELDDDMTRTGGVSDDEAKGEVAEGELRRGKRPGLPLRLDSIVDCVLIKSGGE